MSVNMPNLRLPSKAKFWRKRSSADLTDLDPSYRAIYLGNVLTGWAKGEGCVDKPLSTLWKNHVGTDKPNIVMKVTVCPSGLKAVTKEHGLTEYWANRITYCTADPAYPKVFCWIYRHEGRKLKQELRCHAVLCPSANKAKVMAERLKARLHQALVDFKKEKLWRQNARLSLANSVYENPTMPHRKMLLHTGSMNYRPPIERGKAASKLKMIEEVSFEEEQDEESATTLQDPPEPVAAAALVESDRLNMPSSDTYPLLCHDDTDLGSTFASSTSVSSDNVSLASTVSTVIDSNLDNGVVSVEPQPLHGKQRYVPITNSLVDLSLDGLDDDDDDAEEDLITNHLEKLSGLGSNSPETRRGASVITSEELNDLSKLPVSEQDTISDESGYSEESNATLSSCMGNGTVYANNHKLQVNGFSQENKTDFIEEEDLTVHGVLISDFSNTDRLRYLERTRQASFTGQIQPDFCINI